MRLFENGQGCNLTLFNRNVIKEIDLEEDDPGQINLHLGSGLNNSHSSFGDIKLENRAARGKQGKLSKAGNKDLTRALSGTAISK